MNVDSLMWIRAQVFVRVRPSNPSEANGHSENVVTIPTKDTVILSGRCAVKKKCVHDSTLGSMFMKCLIGWHQPFFWVSGSNNFPLDSRML
jgi:hypothetical protein